MAIAQAMTSTLTDPVFQELAHRYALAWSSHDPKLVASFYAEDGQLSFNRSDPFTGRAGLSTLAAEFMATFPDMVHTIQLARLSGNNGLIAWSLEGHHAGSKNHVKILGWEEWEFDEEMRIKSSRGWFDAKDCENQIANGSISSIVPKVDIDED